ncbi:IS5 family transposase [Sinimarinibacterium flocculans]|uniref:IS5 family transposase n=1 Tax=Sinimarinibacterium flocculans TaxID=985250 RepID=UPI0035127516
MKQVSFGDAEYTAKRKQTRREVFLAEMDQIVPWVTLLSLIEPFYPVAGRGRPPYPIATMLRVHLMQNWFGLSDPAMEEALYEVTSMRRFAQLSMDRIPDETTILNFRHLLEANDLAPEILRRVNAHLTRKGLLLRRGSIVDATIIAAPSSTKNAEGERDPEMHQTKKGNQWFFGMKAHIGADADSGLVHTVVTTPANEADIEVADELLHGKEEVVYADAGYTGADKRHARKRLRWEIAQRPGRIKAMPEGRQKRAIEQIEYRKASIRAKVEHPFRVIKRQFGYMKVRFKGLAKNTGQVLTLFALANLWLVRKKLLAMTGGLRPQFANAV